MKRVLGLFSIVFLIWSTSAPAVADIPITQNAKLVGEKPRSGMYSRNFRHVGDHWMVCNEVTCFGGYRTLTGTLSTKLRTFRLSEGMRRYDYYLLDIDGKVSNLQGDSTGAIADIATITGLPDRDYIDDVSTAGIKASGSSCHGYPIDIGVGWGPVSAGTELGNVQFCGAKPSLTRRSYVPHAYNYRLHDLKDIRTFTLSEIVKVPAGFHPTFQVNPVVEEDTCTKVEYGSCQSWTNSRRGDLYGIGTSG